MQQKISRTLSDAAVAQLRMRNADDLRTVAELQQTAAAFGSPRDDANIPVDAAERIAYLSVQEQSFSLLYELLCREELLWYETYDPAQHSGTQAIDLCRTLRHFLNEADLMAGAFLNVGEHSIPAMLFSNVNPERMVFVLLHQLITMWSEDPTQNTIELFADKSNGTLQIDLLLRHDAAAVTEPLPEPQQSDVYSSTLSEQTAAITERFCKLFDARLIRHSANGARGCRLTLPAAGLLESRMELRSDGAPPIIGAHTAYHAVLSRLIPTEEILWGDICD